MMACAYTLASPCAFFMKPENLHCTAHMSRGPDREFEVLFFHDVNNSLIISTLFWSGDWCAVSVSLTPKQKSVLTMLHSQPHISLSKPPCKELCDVGLFVLKCSNVSDWKQSKDPYVLHSVSTGICETLYQSKTSALQCVYLLDNLAPSTGHSLTIAASSL